MNISIKIVEHSFQKYETCGNWGFDSNGDIWIEVSKLSDWRREILIAIHELCEVVMCKHNGVSQAQVDQFDLDFEAHRPPDNEDEPGDDPNAPYFREHCIATGIERILAAELGVKWSEYENELNALPEVKPKEETK